MRSHTAESAAFRCNRNVISGTWRGTDPTETNSAAMPGNTFPLAPTTTPRVIALGIAMISPATPVASFSVLRHQQVTNQKINRADFTPSVLMAGSTSRLYSKAFAAGVSFVFVWMALRASFGSSAAAPEAVGYLFSAVVLPAIVTGFWASWSLWRIVVTCIATLVVMSVPLWVGTSAVADDAALKADVIAAVRKGFAKFGGQSNTPNLFDTLEARFPNDFNTLVEDIVAVHKSGKPLDSVFAPTEVSDRLVRIQTRDGERVRSAPTASLKAVIAAQRDLTATLKQDKPELCTALVTQTRVQQSLSTAGIARGSVIRLNALLEAIADGRDRPVAARAVENGDYVALVRNAKSRGVDTGSWSLLDAEAARTASPIAVCDALLSSFDAMLSEPGALGERILADQVVGLLTIDSDVHGDAIKH
jgi:hypothetical protein